MKYPVMRHLCNLETVKTYEGTATYTRSSSGSAVTGIAAYKYGSFGLTAVSAVPSPEGLADAAALYALTIFVSAFCCFKIELSLPRSFLPWFRRLGGRVDGLPSVFQMSLLGGYLYAHLSIRYLTPRRQVLAHAVLWLRVCCCCR